MTPPSSAPAVAGVEPKPAETLREKAARLYRDGMRCNCDLDNWEPERDTGHSWVCRIHKAAKAQP